MEHLLHSQLNRRYPRFVAVPKGFRVQLPQSLGWFLRPFGSDPIETPGLEGEWVQVSGGPLPVPILIRIDRAEDGRFLMTGLLIGYRDRREITWETLRAIKPMSLVAWIFEGVDPRNPAKRHVDTDPNPPVSVENPGDVDWEAWFESDEDDPDLNERAPKSEEHERASAAFRLFESTGSAAQKRAEPITRPRASVATDLQEFADVYQRNWAVNPRNATTATAKELHASRATAIRRLAECRELGLISIPKEPQK